MPSWSDLQDWLSSVDLERRGDELASHSQQLVGEISQQCDKNVLFYASGFLQKPEVPGPYLSIGMEDINGFMAGVHGLDFDKELLLILHTPGGMAEAAQSIVEYLRSKFSQISVLIPTYAMSAGTMIALGCDEIIMGRQSQLGPTDPQLVIGNRSYSAHSIVDQFEEAKVDISSNLGLAHAWVPILQQFGPALLLEARKSISYGETLVREWLAKFMFSKKQDSANLASEVASYFGGNQHGSHGRRINREEAKAQHLNVLDLERDQIFQDRVLTLYHLSTIAFELGPASKSVISSNGKMWIKNMQTELLVG